MLVKSKTDNVTHYSVTAIDLSASTHLVPIIPGQGVAGGSGVHHRQLWAGGNHSDVFHVACLYLVRAYIGAISCPRQPELELPAEVLASRVGTLQHALLTIMKDNPSRDSRVVPDFGKIAALLHDVTQF